MRVFLTLWRREVTAYFVSPAAYLLMFFFLILMGLSFGALLNVLEQGPPSSGIMSLLLGESLYFWLAVLMVVPVITMRQFAEEKRSGTFESLMTAPVGEVMVVTAKFLGAFTFFMVLWIPTVAYPFLLAHYASPSVPIDYAEMLVAYAGVGCMGALLVSIGLLASALTRNQNVAAMMTFTALCLLFSLGYLPYYARTPWIQEVGRYASAMTHMIDFSRGVLDTRALVYYGSLTGLMLFMTVKAVEARKWNS